MLETYLVEQCAPTLASLKLGSMFALTVPAGEDMEQEVRQLNAAFERKGLYLTVLRRRGERATVYLCRVSQLASELAKPEVAQFLRRCREFGARPLSDLTGGIHLHTLRCPDGEVLRPVLDALERGGFLLPDQRCGT